jgi:hypothetical protein
MAYIEKKAAGSNKKRQVASIATKASRSLVKSDNSPTRKNVSAVAATGRKTATPKKTLNSSTRNKLSGIAASASRSLVKSDNSPTRKNVSAVAGAKTAGAGRLTKSQVAGIGRAAAGSSLMKSRKKPY